MLTETQKTALIQEIHRQIGNLGELRLEFDNMRLALNMRWEFLGCYIEFNLPVRMYEVIIDTLATFCTYAVETIRRESRNQIHGTSTR